MTPTPCLNTLTNMLNKVPSMIKIRNLRLGIAAVMLAVAGPLSAAGMTAHSMMADAARFKLPAGHPLIGLLEAHRPALIAGAMFPDGGYFTGVGFETDRDLAETSHWGAFTNALAEVAHEKGCGDQLSDGDAWDALPVLGGTVDWVADELAREAVAVPLRIGDSCGYLVAFAMGVAAHGMGDEVWDALFEPSVYQRGEQAASSPAFTLDAYPPGADPSVGNAVREVVGDEAFAMLSDAVSAGSVNGVEYAMDVIAIRDKFAWEEVPALVFPPMGDIVAAFSKVDKNYDELAVQRAALGGRLLVAAERAGAAADYVRVREQMPFAVHNYLSGSGGVEDTAQYVSGYYEHLYQKVVMGPDDSPRPFVVGMHPRAGERNLPANPCIADAYAVCEDTANGGALPIADRYIYVSLSSDFDENIQGLVDAFVVFDEAGEKLPASIDWLPGWAHGGAHGFRLKLDNPVLKPNHRYTVVLTTQVYDYRGPDNEKAKLAAPVIWHFNTGAE